MHWPGVIGPDPTIDTNYTEKVSVFGKLLDSEKLMLLMLGAILFILLFKGR